MTAPPPASPPHRIRLRGPWTVAWLAGDPPAAFAPSGTGKVSLPAAWNELFGPVPGTVRFGRVFHRPARLDSFEQVVLCLEGCGGTVRAALDGRDLGTIPDGAGRGEFDVTPFLQADCRLALDVTCDPTRCGEPRPLGLWGQIVLEIRDVRTGRVPDDRI